MSIFLDFLVCFIIVFSVIKGIKKGFVRTILEFLAMILAAIFALVARPYVMPFVKDNMIAPHINELTQSGLDSSGISGMLDSLSRAFKDSENEGKPMLSGQESGMWLVDFVSENIAGILSFIVLFLVFILAFRLIIIIIDAVFKLPVLKEANKLLGLAAGLIKAFISLFVLSLLLFLFINLTNNQSFITTKTVDGTIIFEPIYNYSISLPGSLNN